MKRSITCIPRDGAKDSRGLLKSYPVALPFSITFYKIQLKDMGRRNKTCCRTSVACSQRHDFIRKTGTVTTPTCKTTWGQVDDMHENRALLLFPFANGLTQSNVALWLSPTGEVCRPRMPGAQWFLKYLKPRCVE